MSLTTQFYTMIAMIGMGSWLGAALDTYGRFLKRPKRAHWFVFINDILFWVIQGLIIFYTLLLVNQGELRFYIFIALLCGYAGYQSIFRKFYLQALEIFIQAAISTYRFIIRTCQVLIIRPIKALLHFLVVLLMGILHINLVIAKFIFNVILVIIKIILTPFKWVGILVWRMLPKTIRNFLVTYFMKIAGFLKKAENKKLILYKLWKKIRKS